VRGRVTVLAGAAAAIGAVAARVLRRQRRRAPESDPRADELRQRLEQSRAVVSEREEFEGAETPVDEVKPVGEVDERRTDLDQRRRDIHDRARTAAEEMRGD
jgi:uncharacterized membrane-anchored protein YhcB (DUF1043 family)